MTSKTIEDYLGTNNNGKDKSEFIKKVSDLCKQEKLLLLEYTYLQNYARSNISSIVNTSWITEIANNTDDKEFKKIIVKTYPQVFKIIDTKLIVDIEGIENKLLKKLEFTDDQKNALHNIMDFLIDKTKNVYGLYGFAGTGKTTTIVELSHFLLKNNLISSVIFSAPTNKAVNVIKSKYRIYLKDLYEDMSGEALDDGYNFDDIVDKLLTYNIKIDFVTIHKLLKFKSDFSVDGDRVFIRNGDSIITKYEFIIIDECSMIPMNLINTIFEEIKKGEQKSGDNYKQMPKVLLCGDPAQLPPVNEAFSCIFVKPEQITLDLYSKQIVKNETVKKYDNEDLKIKYDKFVNNIKTLQSSLLKEVVRSKIDSVTNACLEVRKWVISNSQPNLAVYKTKKGVNFYEFKDDQKKVSHEWFNKALKKFENRNEMNIIITWTNRQTDEYNSVIRKILFDNKTLKRFEKGDILMLNDFYNIDTDDKLYTSEQVIVLNTKIVHKNCGEFTVNYAENTRKLKEFKNIDKHVKDCVDKINKNTKRLFKAWQLTVVKSKDDDPAIIFVIDESDNTQLEKEKEYAMNQIKSVRKTLLSTLRNRFQVDNHVTKVLWKEYYRIFIEQFANVNYGYSISCHKAQGSNFYNVFVDAHDILLNGNEDEMKRCLYTAMTRTVNELSVLI
uniref:UvrD-like helicase C-terminal domain-containing protein n=1 Tax=viral metagenome TaxID=1070528 RepID=A0A6C0EB50_9ZZZZ